MKKKFKILALTMALVMCVQAFPITAKASADQQFVGEIMLFAGDFAPRGWAFCSGQLLPISQNTALFSLLGTYYGGDGKTTFALPNLEGSVPVGAGQGLGLSTKYLGEASGVEKVTLLTSELPIHNHPGNVNFKIGVDGTGTVKCSSGIGTTSSPGNNTLSKGVRNERIYSSNTTGSTVTMKAGSVGISNQTLDLQAGIQPSGGNLPHNNMEPYLALHYIIALQGFYPPHGDGTGGGPGGTTIGEIKMFAGNFAPAGYYFCDGSLIPISENESLFNLIGTTYGGDGQSTFALPDLRGRSPIGMGQGNGLTNRVLGEIGGWETVTLTTSQMPAHPHAIYEVTQASAPTGFINYANGYGNTASPENHVLANGTRNEKVYSTSGYSSMAADSVAMNLNIINPDITSTVGNAGGSQPHENMMPYQAINFIISASGVFPTPDTGVGDNPFIGEIRMFPFSFAPKGWASCNGQLLSTIQNQPSFAILGTNYGGNGTTTFGLPDLRGRAPIGVAEKHPLGQVGGEERHTLAIAEMPSHIHSLTVSPTINGSGTIIAAGERGNTNSPVNTLLSKGFKNERIYSTALPTLQMPNVLNINVTISPLDSSGNKASQIYTSAAGISMPHENMKPYTVVNFVIALQGIFPSQN